MANIPLIKSIQPYLNYAAQLRQSIPIMAYNCKLYAVQKGLDICKQNPGEEAMQAKAMLISEMDDLAQMKKALGEIDKDDMVTAIDNFVLSVFAKAD